MRFELRKQKHTYITGRGLYNVPLYKVLKQSYEDNHNTLSEYGFHYEPNHSTNDYQTFFKPQTRQLIFSVTGTHNLSDWATDVKLAIGDLKNTKRLQQAAKALQRAKEAFKPLEVTVTGHSLGGAIAQYIASGSDKVVTLDKGATFNQPTRANERAYRTAGDIVSFFGKGITTLKNPNTWIPGFNAYNIYKAHDIDNIKNSNLFI